MNNYTVYLLREDIKTDYDAIAVQVAGIPVVDGASHYGTLVVKPTAPREPKWSPLFTLARPSHQSFRWGRIGVSTRVSHVRPDPRSQILGNQRVRKAAFDSLHPLHHWLPLQLAALFKPLNEAYSPLSACAPLSRLSRAASPPCARSGRSRGIAWEPRHVLAVAIPTYSRTASKTKGLSWSGKRSRYRAMRVMPSDSR